MFSAKQEALRRAVGADRLTRAIKATLAEQKMDSQSRAAFETAAARIDDAVSILAAQAKRDRRVSDGRIQARQAEQLAGLSEARRG
jgi:hypothetical protein